MSEAPRRVLVESLPDVASRGIAARLRSGNGWRPTHASFGGHPVWSSPEALLITIDELHLDANNLDGRLDEAGIEPREIVFLSKHRSESGRPTLTAHPVGNFGEARFGGRPGRLGACLGSSLTHMLRCLHAARHEHGYPADVAFETTHHGPLLATPAFFVELGSAEADWANPAGHEVLAQAVTRFLATPPEPGPTVIGLGGGHYAPRFTEAALTKAVQFAHMLPTHHAKAAEPVPLAAEMARASPGASGVYVHDGTLPKALRDAWLDAFRGAGMPEAQSRDWAPRGSVSTGPPTML